MTVLDVCCDVSLFLCFFGVLLCWRITVGLVCNKENWLVRA